MEKLIHNIGNTAISFTKKTGEVILHFYSSFINIRPFRFKELLLQIEFVGNKSILIICITGLFTGFVFAYQTWLGLNLFDIENIIGTVSALSTFREIGPVMTGIILSARAGGAIAARLGTMVVTDQVDAIEVMGISSKNYLIAPRILASIIATPLLTVVFSIFAMLGCYILAVKLNNLDEAVFWSKTLMWLGPRDIIEGLIKASVFGLLFSVICTYIGMNTKKGAAGVGEATNNSIVTSIVCIIVADYFITRIIGLFWGFI